MTRPRCSLLCLIVLSVEPGGGGLDGGLRDVSDPPEVGGDCLTLPLLALQSLTSLGLSLGHPLGAWMCVALSSDRSET